MYKINLESYASVFALPTEITDRHLKLAGSTQLKVLLYAFRHPENEINTENLSSLLGIPNGDICDALQYWVECGFISKDGKANEIKKTVTEIPPVPTQITPPPVKEDEEPTKQTKEELHIYKPTQSQVAARVDESAEIRSLFFEMQRIFKRAIGFDTQSTILYLMDYAGLPAEVIIMLCEYLVSNGQTGIRAIEKMGLSWAEKEINTFEKATAQIERLEKTTTEWRQLRVLMGLENEKPTSTQKNYLDIWLNEYQFSTEIIYYAYEKTADKTGKISFAYMNTMLKDWHGKNLKSINEIEENSEVFKSQLTEIKDKSSAKKKPTDNKKPAPSYDINKAFDSYKIPTKTKRGQ